MKTTKDILSQRNYISHVDDERNIGNGIIVTLSENWYFHSDPGCGVRGFDTWREALDGCKKSEVYEIIPSKQ